VLVRQSQTSQHALTPLRTEAAAATDIGLERRSNQDKFGFDCELDLYVVCDGMGGAAGGEIASSIAVETFLGTVQKELAPPRSSSVRNTCVALQRAVAAANRAVLARASWDTRYRGMGTTLVAARVAGDTLILVNIGDSRAYLFRQGHIVQMTEDHSYVAEQVRLGLMTAAEAEASSLQSVITRAIGVELDVRPDLYTVTLKPGDTLLLTSDGLLRHVDQVELAQIVPNLLQPPDEVCQKLIDLANQRGGMDNSTCIVVRAVSDSRTPQ
jgi:serine/threonine protein phosphatase PrpC